jgi:hypothetical protein
MAKSRQQLIQGSSFLKNEKEKLGGLNVKRSTITADSFKKGTSQQSSDNIEGRVTANEKKITLLKNIVKLRKQNVDKQLKPEAEQDKSQQMGSPLLESLQSIASTVDSIRDTLIQQQDNDKGVAESMRREREEKDRASQEKKLEKPKLLQKFADPIIKPVMSIWSKILNFIKTLFLGKILMNFIDWFGNPANQGKIITLVRFVKDWWPALTAAVLLFGTGFGGLVAGLIKTIMWFIPAMGKAIVALKSAKFMKMIPGGGKIGAIAKVAAPLALAGGVGYGIGRMQGGDDQQEPLQMNKGGTVPGSGNKDTVPAMLTPGEFVMSKGAVQEYGVDTLEGMNAAAGGTNIPVLMPDKKRKGFADGGDPTTPTAADFGLREDFDYDNPEHQKEFVKVVSPFLKQFMEQQNAAVDENPDAYNGIKLKMDRDGKMPNFGEFIANQSEAAFNNSVGMVQSNEEIPPEASQALFQKMTFIRSQTLDNPNFKGDMAFDINKDIPGTAANRLFLRAQADTTSAAAKAGISAEDRARQMNKMGYTGGGLVQHFMSGGLVQGLQGGGQPMTQERANAMAEAFDNRPMAQLEKLRNERDAMDRGPDGKLSRKDRKRWNEIGAEIHAIQSQIIASRGGTSTPTQTPVTEKKKGGGLFGGLKRVVGGTADQLTGNLFDFDKKSGGGLIRKTAGAVGGLFGGGKKEGGSKGGSSGILGPISSNVDAMVNTDKYEVKPKEKKNTVVAYEQAVNEQQQQDQEADAGGNEIPQFTLRPSFMIDPAKVDVLGIVV